MVAQTATEKDRILVVGGGIGGLTAAVALAKVGHRVTVLERAGSFAEVGAGIQLAPNATRVLDRLGVLDALRPVSVWPRRLVLGDALSGSELTALPLEDFPQRYGAPYLVLHRSDLLQALVRECTRLGVTLRTRTEVLGADDDGRQATVRTRVGEDIVGSAVIAADGLWSRLRSGFVADDEPRCEGFVAYRGAVPSAKVARYDRDDVVAWIGPDFHLVQYPVRGGQLYNQVAVFRSPSWNPGSNAPWGTPEELERTFSRCAPHLRAGAALLRRDLRWPMYDRQPLLTWARGRIALLGDAAHPMFQYLAQGACQAIMDAEALAGCLDRPGLDPAGIECALLAYQERRALSAARVQRDARTWGDIWHADGLARLLRDELLRARDPRDYHHVDALYAVPSSSGTELSESEPTFVT